MDNQTETESTPTRDDELESILRDPILARYPRLLGRELSRYSERKFREHMLNNLDNFVQLLSRRLAADFNNQRRK